MMVEIDIDFVKKMGVIVFFFDKYGDKVCVVKIGDFNIEFCGGDYVKNINEIGFFKIVFEGGVGVGVWWIEVVMFSDVFVFM